MSLQAKRAPLDPSYHFPVHSCGCPSCVSRLTPEATDRAFAKREALRRERRASGFQPTTPAPVS